MDKVSYISSPDSHSKKGFDKVFVVIVLVGASRCILLTLLRILPATLTFSLSTKTVIISTLFVRCTKKTK